MSDLPPSSSRLGQRHLHHLHVSSLDHVRCRPPMAPPGLFGPISRQPTRAHPSPSLVHRHDSFASTFITRRRPPCRIHHLRNTSRNTRHTPRCGQSLITQRERTSLGSSAITMTSKAWSIVPLRLKAMPVLSQVILITTRSTSGKLTHTPRLSILPH